jgi:hypothetical protein
MTDQAPGELAVRETERIPVRFRGEGTGTGTGDLTWGQHEIWRQMREHGSWLPIGGVFPLRAGATVADTVGDLRWVMSRYPSMRTRWTLEPGRASQQVLDTGEVTLEVIDAPDDADPTTVALDVWQRYWNQEFDFGADWPVRMAVIRHRGTPTRRVWMMCHLVTDGTGGRVIVQEMADRANSGSTTMPPLEQARWQRSPAGQRQSRIALRHWERALRRAPVRPFPTPTGRPSPRYWQGQLESLATHLAVRAISARTGVESPSVLLATFAVALARVTGADRVATQVTVNNRFRPGLARTVSPIAQNGLCLIEVPDTTVDDVVRAARRGAMAAYKNAYYDPDRRDELIDRIGRERGEPVELDCYFNDRRIRPRDETGPAPVPAQIREALPGTGFEWTHQQDYMPFEGLHVNIEDTATTARVTMPFDTHRVSPEVVEACLWEMQEVAVTAALDPDTGTGSRAAG